MAEIIVDNRNVSDNYKGWTEELIRDDLKTKQFPFAVMMSQLSGDFNFGTVIRNANGFGAKEVFYYGKKKFDRRSACGAYHYTGVNFLSNYDEIVKLKESYTLVGLDNVKDSVPIDKFVWPNNSLIVIGEEQNGLTSEILELCSHTVSITMFGSVRSFNAGVASGIAMYDFVNKFNS